MKLLKKGYNKLILFITMQKLILKQTIGHKLSTQQIQFIKLLQLSDTEITSCVSKELGENPALEEENIDTVAEKLAGEKDIDPYISTPYQSLHFQNRKVSQGTDPYFEKPIAAKSSWREHLLDQLASLKVDEKFRFIGNYLIGNMGTDGYIRRNLELIVDELALIHYIDTNVGEVAEVLATIQTFEPVGVGARNLRECLLLQLERKPLTQEVTLAKKILTKYFDAFSKKNYTKVMNKLATDRELIKKSLQVISKLHPTPVMIGKPENDYMVLRPDFIVSLQEDGKLKVTLYKDRVPLLKINQTYADLLIRYHNAKDIESKETIAFIKQKIQRAQWFIVAIKQRQKTLLRTMQAIVDLQHLFFVQGNEALLRPIFLRDVAERIGMDVSTISRVVSQKAVQTDWGIYSLKYFFSEPINTLSGEKVSSRAIKRELLQLIEKESKQTPYSDGLLTEQLKAKGYLLARRTVAKYREQLKIPVARLRKGI